eukprot:365355-Chlamydomonas_euryale.AAC.6
MERVPVVEASLERCSDWMLGPPGFRASKSAGILARKPSPFALVSGGVAEAVHTWQRQSVYRNVWIVDRGTYMWGIMNHVLRKGKS